MKQTSPRTSLSRFGIGSGGGLERNGAKPRRRRKRVGGRGEVDEGGSPSRIACRTISTATSRSARGNGTRRSLFPVERSVTFFHMGIFRTRVENTRVCGAVRRARPISNPRYPESTAASRSVGGGARRRSRSCTSRGDALLARTSLTNMNTMSATRCVYAMARVPVALAGASRATRARRGRRPGEGPRRVGSPRASRAPRSRRARGRRRGGLLRQLRVQGRDPHLRRRRPEGLHRPPANFCIIEGGARDKVRDFAT